MKNLDIISQLEKGEWIVDICHNFRLADHSVCTILMIMLIELKKMLSQAVKCLFL